MSQHGTRSFCVEGVVEVHVEGKGDVAVAVAVAVALACSGPRRLTGAGDGGAACEGNGIRAGFGGGSSCTGAGTTSGGGAFNGLCNGAFAEMLDVAPRAGTFASGTTAANALRNVALDGLDALDRLDALVALGALDAPDGSIGVARIAPRMTRACVAHDGGASPRIAERVDISG